MDNNILKNIQITSRDKVSHETKEIEVSKFEVRGNLIITTKLLSKIYGCSPKNIKDNFLNHKDKFQESKHYFLLEGEELKDFKRKVDNIDLVPSNVNKLYVWTERGALNHAKILDTDLAWDTFDILVNTYFKTQNTLVNQYPKLSKELQAIFLLDGKTEELKGEINGVREDLEYFKDNAPLFNSECDELMDLVKSVATKSLGGYKSPAYNDKSLRSKIYSDIQQQLRREFGVRKYKYIKRNQLSKAKDILTNYYAPTVLVEEIEIVNNQVSLEECCCTK